ncbi:MAG: hypothetical protein QW179_03140 [Candidatus Hadarchaeales archaeon]
MSRLVALLTIFIILAGAQQVAAWGSSTHHDQATIISKAFKQSPSVPQAIRDNIDSDFIYSTSLAPDDWRGVTGTWGTWHYNMAENAYYEFRRIYEAWKNGDFDNAIGRIGIVLHYIGDVMYMPHNQGIRDWYINNIPPIGSVYPLWGFHEESGKYFTANYYYDSSHYANQQVEAYTDSDSAWYPTRPENYGPDDNGDLTWFLNRYFYDVGDGPGQYPENDYPSYTICDTVLEQHIIQSNPYTRIGPTDVDDRIDNRWLYWVRTRDASIAKMDADNTIRLVYNGVYRALRDAWNWRWANNKPDAPFFWEWPTTTTYYSLNDNLYREGMDTARWASQQVGALTEASAQTSSLGLIPLQPLILLTVAAVLSSLLTALLSRKVKR